MYIRLLNEQSFEGGQSGIPDVIRRLIAFRYLHYLMMMQRDCTTISLKKFLCERVKGTALLIWLVLSGRDLRTNQEVW